MRFLNEEVLRHEGFLLAMKALTVAPEHAKLSSKLSL